jgi:hypothetical protein
MRARSSRTVHRPDEILVTDEVFDIPGAWQVVGDLPTEASSVVLKGVAGAIRVHESLAEVLRRQPR